MAFECFCIVSLYLTYEGLKPRLIDSATGSGHFRLYLTYEGLKLCCKVTSSSNGKVCILPMRDWNLDSLFSLQCLFVFVSYLWGIETQSWRLRPCNPYTSLYLTYEGLKHPLIRTSVGKCNPFVSYLWGIETWKIKRNRTIPKRVCILPMRDWNRTWSLW